MLTRIPVYQVLTGSLILLFLLFTGCTPVSKQADEVIIGVAWPFGKVALDHGIDLAVKEINETGGINGRRLVLLKEDDGSELVRGLAIAQSFAENTKVQAVVGHFDSFISVPASAIYDKAGLVMFSPGSTAPELTSSGYQHIFRNIPSDNEIARRLIERLAANGHRRLVIHFSDDAYGRGLAIALENQATDHGITIIDRFTDYTGITGLKRLHRRWQAFGFDGVLIARKLPAGAEFIRDALLAGINTQFVGGDAFDSPQLLAIGEFAEDVVVASAFDMSGGRSDLDQFVDSFYEEYGTLPEASDALGYDAVKMLAAAMARSDLNNRSTIAQELRNLERWQGVTGTHRFNQEGENLAGSVAIKIVEDGIFKLLTGNKL